MTDKERLINVFERKEVDRKPCICPGGMMNMITKDIMSSSNIFWPKAHTNAEAMAKLAYSSYQNKCFDNVGVPFCMTIEAENMGAKVNMGTDIFEPHVSDYAIESVEEYEQLKDLNPLEGRAQVVFEAIRILKNLDREVPIIGNVTGPISTASSVVDANNFYIELKKKNESSHRFLELVTNNLIKYANAQVDAGIDVITIADPSATGEILGPKLFEEFGVKYLNVLIKGIREHNNNVKIITHICGQMKSVFEKIAKIDTDVFSFDSNVSIVEAKNNLPAKLLMGNISTYTLEYGTVEQVKKMTINSIKLPIDIISPACGLGTKSPLENIQIVLQTVKDTKI